MYSKIAFKNVKKSFKRLYYIFLYFDVSSMHILYF